LGTLWGTRLEMLLGGEKRSLTYMRFAQDQAERLQEQGELLGQCTSIRLRKRFLRAGENLAPYAEKSNIF
jgi:hypothetical protein